MALKMAVPKVEVNDSILNSPLIKTKQKDLEHGYLAKDEQRLGLTVEVFLVDKLDRSCVKTFKQPLLVWSNVHFEQR